LNLELESGSSKIATVQSTHDDMSAKPCKNCTMIMVSYADLWLVHSYVARILDGASLELRELKARSTLLGAYTSCPLFRSDLEAAAIEIKDFLITFSFYDDMLRVLHDPPPLPSLSSSGGISLSSMQRVFSSGLS
jgi:hypothetical protein